MRWLKVFIALLPLLLIACPKPIPSAEEPDVTLTRLQTCSTVEPDLKPSNVCDGLFTSEGYACARCPHASGCWLSDVSIYCSKGPCAKDPRCKTQR